MSQRCPFIDPEYELDNHIPCPVCGMLGFGPVDDEDLCVGDGDEESTTAVVWSQCREFTSEFNR